jgi:diguanylate cyclase (GGDEF)-like protein
VTEFLKSREFADATAVFEQGDAGDELYVVCEGRVAVRVRSSEGNEIDVAEFGAGDFFGEMAIFENAPRSATCVMVDGGKLYVLSKQDFFSLMQSHPSLALKIMYRMVAITNERLQRTGSFLSELVQWGEGARRRAVTDDLTGLYNRRYLDSTLEQQFQDARVRNEVFSLIMMDLDRFHAINDNWSQQFGDEVIQHVAPAVSRNVRQNDIAARYGGDEFTIILPGTRAEAALAVAEAIRLSVEQLEIEAPDGTVLKVTTSQGVAEFPRHGTTVEEIKSASDQALYQAKEAGRNTASIYAPAD